MKIKLALGAMALFCLISASALAGGWQGDHDMDGVYMGGYVGQGWASDFRLNYEIANNGSGEAGIVYKTRAGVRGGATWGYKYGNLRFDLDFSYITNSLDEVVYLNAGLHSAGQLVASNYLGNVYYDFNQGSKVIPYLGFGAGITNVRGRTVVSARSPDMLGHKSVVSYQTAAGLGYQFTHFTRGFIDYRYLETKMSHWKAFHAQESAFNNNARGRYKNGSINLGMSYYFG